MNKEEFEELHALQGRIGNFIKEVSAPIKTQTNKDTAEYLDRFIKFPAALLFTSVLFTNSDLVKTKELAVAGLFL